MERTKKYRENMPVILLGLCVFAFLFLFFSSVHPLMMHDGDDWAYSTYTRTVLPVWGGWNPTRVLPEIISPLVAYAAAYLVLPLIPDLSWAMVVTYALFFSFVITVYVLLFVRFMRRRFALSGGWASAMGVLFFLSHFLILRGAVSGNVHMFYSWNVNTYFFYLLADLLGASLVLYFGADSRRGYAIDGRRPLESGCFFVLLYLAIFSNMFSNYIVTVCAGLMLLGRIAAAPRTRTSIVSALQSCGWLIVTIVLWCVCAVFELSGGRAESYQTEMPFIEKLRLVYGGLLDVVESLNPLFVVVCLLMLGAGCVCFFLPHRAKTADSAVGECLWLLPCAFFLSGCYLVLLAALTGPTYIERPDVIFGAVFFMLMLVLCAAAYLLRRFPVTAMLIPVICFVFYFEIDTRWGTFKEPNLDNLPASECAAINQALMDQMFDAAARGETNPKIEVPQGPYWYIADHMSVALYKFGLIEHEMYASNIEIEDFYEKYDIR